MSSNFALGVGLLVLGALGLFIEYIWREVVGRATGPMITFYTLMLLPMMAGVFFVLEPLGWHLVIRLLVGAVGGYMLFHAVYLVCGLVYSIFR